MLRLIVTGRAAEADRLYGPRGAKDELDEELADLKARGAIDNRRRERSPMSLVVVGITSFFVMVGLMLLGMPIAAVMMLLGLVGGMSAHGFAFFTSSASVAWGVMSENNLTAIPLFVLLGEFLLRSGMADRMYTVFAAWLGRLPGGLLHTNIGCCALFAATSGSSVATAATIGTVALPSLRKNGYPMSDSLGSLAAGGTLGIMIPPSINFIIYGSMTNTSVGKLFIAGIIPGLALAGLFMLWIYVSNVRRAERLAIIEVPWDERVRLLRYLFEPLVVFGIVMGTLYAGIATATESAALGLVVAFVFVVLQGKLSMALLENCFVSSAKTTGMILLIVLGAFVLNLALSLTGIGEALTKWVTGFGLGRVQLLMLLIVLLPDPRHVHGHAVDDGRDDSAWHSPSSVPSASIRSGSASSSC